MERSGITWWSERLERDMPLVRWGHYGTPVLIFPTAGGDAEEIERFLLIQALAPLIDDGRIKVYSIDSVAGRTWLTKQHSPAYCSLLQNRFHAYVADEVVPAVRSDCNSDDIELIAAGASIGAFNASAVVCRYPEHFRLAVAMSGTFDLSNYLHGAMFDDFYFSSPLHFLSRLEGPQLERLRSRFILLASGEGDYENIGESWRLADVLGSRGIPNRVDSWGSDWDHDWETWRAMLPKYLDEHA